MTFESMDLRNFMVVEEATVPLCGQGLVLIEGDNRDDETMESNGAGKSSIFEALLWGLYGVTLKYGSDGDKVVKRGEKSASVTVRFRDDNARSWEITRSRPARLEVVRGGKPLTTGSMKETQALIDDAVGMDVATFTNTVLFGQGRVLQFSALTDKEQKAVLERLIGVEAITEAHKNAKAKLSLAEHEVEKHETARMTYEEEREELEADIEELATKSKNWASDRKKRLSEAKDDLAATKVPCSSADAQRKVQDAEEEVERQQRAERASRKEVDVARDALAHAQSALSSAQDDHATAKRAVESAEKLTGTCKTCGQQIEPAHRQKHIKEARDEVKRLATVVQGHDKAVDEARTAVKETRKTLDDRTQFLDKCRKALVDAMSLVSEAKSAEATRKVKEKRVFEIGNETNVYEEQLDKTQRKMVKVKAVLTETEEALTEAKRERAHLAFLVDALSNKGLKSFVLDSVAPFLNQKATHYLSKLTGGNITVEFRTQSQLKSGEWREKFEVSAINQYGADLYAGNSGGEKRKIDVAVALALQALAASRAKSQINLALYDEPFDALDATAGEYAMDLLAEEAQKKDTVLVISHREEFKSMFPRSWMVVKESGASRIEM